MKPKFVKQAFIYMSEDLVLLNPVARTIDGWGFGLPEITQAKRSDPASIGRCLLEALAKSADDLPNDVDSKGSLKTIVAMTKSKSWRAFQRRAVLALAYLKPGSDRIKLVPTRNEGSKGWAHLDDLARWSTADPLDLGSNVLASLLQAEL